VEGGKRREGEGEKGTVYYGTHIMTEMKALTGRVNHP
jgi:hypothetical protein